MTSYGYLSGGGQLQPMAPPLIDDSDLSKPLTLRLDEPASISVRISGCPQPSVRWQIGRKRVRESVKHRLETDGHGSYTLVVSKVTRDLEQGVWVVATNDLGEDCCLVEVRTLEIVFKQRAFKKDPKSMRRTGSLSTDRSESLSRADTSLHSSSTRNGSMLSLKDWKDEMTIRNKMRSVDDLVFTSDKASLMSGLGYSLSVNLADSDDPDFNEQFLSLSKRHSRRPPAPPIKTPISFVFQEMEPRRPPGKDPGFNTPARIRESELEEASPSGTRQPTRLPEAVESAKDVTLVNSEHSDSGRNSAKENIDRAANKVTKKKKKKRKKTNESVSLRTITGCENSKSSEALNAAAAAAAAAVDSEGGYGDRNSNKDNLNLVSENDSVWELFGENMSNFCHDIFDAFPKLKKRNSPGDVIGPLRNPNDQLSTEASKSVEIPNDTKHENSKFGILRNSTATDQTADREPAPRQKRKPTKKPPADAATAAEQANEKAEIPKKNRVEVTSSECQNVPLNDLEICTRRSKKPRTLPPSSGSSDRAEIKVESSNSVGASLIKSESVAKSQKKLKNSRVVKSKSDAKLDSKDVAPTNDNEEIATENSSEFHTQLDGGSKELKQKHSAEKQPPTKKRAKDKGKTKSETKCNTSKAVTDKGNNILEISNSQNLETATTITDKQSGVQNDRSIEPQTVDLLDQKATGPTTLGMIVIETVRTTKESSRTRSSSSNYKEKRKKSVKTKKWKDEAPLNSSYAVIAGEGFIVDMEKEPRAGGGAGAIIEEVTKTPSDQLTVESKVGLTLNTDSNHNSDFVIKSSVDEISAKLKAKSSGKMKNLKIKKTKDLSDSIPNSGKTEVVSFEIAETPVVASESVSSVTTKRETVEPVNDVLEYCNEPIRLRPKQPDRAPVNTNLNQPSDDLSPSELSPTAIVSDPDPEQRKHKLEKGGKKIRQKKRTRDLSKRRSKSDPFAGSEVKSAVETYLNQPSSDHLSPSELNSTAIVSDPEQRKYDLEKGGKKIRQKKRTIDLSKRRSKSNPFTGSEVRPSVAPTVPDSTPESSESPASIDTAPESIQFPDGGSVPVLGAHETLILKALAEKLSSGQIEIIIVNKGIQSNATEGVANNFSSTQDHSTVSLQEKSGRKTVKFTETNRISSKQNEETQRVEPHSDIWLSVDQAASGSEHDGLSDTANHLLRMKETPVPKPRTRSVKESGIVEYLAENLTDRQKQGHVVPDTETSSEPMSKSRGPSLPSSTQKNNESIPHLEEPRKHHAESPDASIVNKRSDSSSNEQTRENGNENDKRMVYQQTFSNNSSTSKEDLESPVPNAIQETDSRRTMVSKSEPYEKSSQKSSSSGTTNNRNASADEPVKSKSTGCQTDTTLTSPPSNDVMTLTSERKAKSGNQMTQVSISTMVDNDEETISQSPPSIIVTSGGSQNEVKTARSAPIKPYVPVFPNYFHGYGGIYQRLMASEPVRDTGVMNNPGESPQKPFPYLASASQNRSTRQTTAERGSLNDDGKRSTMKSENIGGETSTLVKNSEVRERSSQGALSKSEQTKNMRQNLSNNSAPNSSLNKSSRQIEPSNGFPTKDSNLKHDKSPKESFTSSQTVSFIDDGSSEWDRRDLDTGSKGLVDIESKELTVGVGRIVSALKQPKTVAEKEFVTSAVTLEFGEMIKLYPAK